MKRTTYMAIFLAAIVGAGTALSAGAEEDTKSEMQDGMNYYHQHRYLSAIARFGTALPNEFNNSNMHYYLANCMVFLHHRDDAVREYRIAYALNPSGTTGRYSQMCLNKFGIDAEGKIVKEKKKEPIGDAEGQSKIPTIDEDSKQVLAEMAQQKKDGSFYVKNYTAEYFVRKKKKPALTPEGEQNAAGEKLASQTVGADAAIATISSKEITPMVRIPSHQNQITRTSQTHADGGAAQSKHASTPTKAAASTTHTMPATVASIAAQSTAASQSNTHAASLPTHHNNPVDWVSSWLHRSTKSK
jgi:hypothetical protein